MGRAAARGLGEQHGAVDAAGDEDGERRMGVGVHPCVYRTNGGTTEDVVPEGAES